MGINFFKGKVGGLGMLPGDQLWVLAYDMEVGNNIESRISEFIRVLLPLIFTTLSCIPNCNYCWVLDDPLHGNCIEALSDRI